MVNKAIGARATAAKVVMEVVTHHRALNSVLTVHLADLEQKDRSLCQQICYGVIRWYHQLNAICEHLLRKPLKKKDSDLNALLLCGLYQLQQLRIPPHAAISETVNACKALDKSWATGLINGCLRHYQRQKTELEQKIESSPTAKFSHPDWLIKQYQTDWGEKWGDIVNANNQQPPMMLRVNQQQGSKSDYLSLLNQASIAATPIEQCPDAVLLASPCDVYKLPGFVDGKASVQDGAAQLVVELLDLSPNQRILDACAAPGGKTGHILERCPENDVVALDIDATRLANIADNLQRLNLNASLISADGTNPDDWWDGRQFDRILIDAPCSGSGVIRRNPDIKLLRRPDDIASLAKQQHDLLENLWPLLKPNGLMVYTTCSIIKQENEDQIRQFLAKHPEAQHKKNGVAHATECEFGYQRLPGDNSLDGFYYAVIQHR